MMVEPGIAAGVAGVVGDASLKAAIVIAVVAFWALLDQRSSAAFRHMVWTVALVSAAALVLAEPLVPAWRLPVPLPDRRGFGLAGGRMEEAAARTWAPVAASTAGGRDAVSEPAFGSTDVWRPEAGPTSGPVLASPTGAPAAADIEGPGSGVRLPAGLLIVLWLGGAGAVVLSLSREVVMLRRLERVARPVESGELYREFVEASARMGVTRAVRLLAGPGNVMPMTWGERRPVVLVPSDAVSWPPARLRAVLRHELAHVARHDALVHFVTELACALHWFNPIVWFAAKRQREERERACDDRVLRCGSPPADYATELVGLARTMVRGRRAVQAGMAMARSDSLRGRLRAVLTEDRNRAPVEPAQVTRAVFIALLTILPLACLAPSSRGPTPVEEREAIVGVYRGDEGEVVIEPERDVPVMPVLRAVTVPAVAPRPAASPDVPVVPMALVPAPVLEPVRVQDVPVVPMALVPTRLPALNALQDVRMIPQSIPLPVMPLPAEEREAPAMPVAAVRQAGDREIIGLLDAVLASGGLRDAETRHSFIAAARIIRSEHERVRLFEALIETGPDTANLTEMLEAAAEIRSDSELAGLLARVARSRQLTGTALDAWWVAASRIESVEARREALSALSGGR